MAEGMVGLERRERMQLNVTQLEELMALHREIIAIQKRLEGGVVDVSSNFVQLRAETFLDTFCGPEVTATRDTVAEAPWVFFNTTLDDVGFTACVNMDHDVPQRVLDYIKEESRND